MYASVLMSFHSSSALTSTSSSPHHAVPEICRGCPSCWLCWVLMYASVLMSSCSSPVLASTSSLPHQAVPEIDRESPSCWLCQVLMYAPISMSSSCPPALASTSSPPPQTFPDSNTCTQSCTESSPCHCHLVYHWWDTLNIWPSVARVTTESLMSSVHYCLAHVCPHTAVLHWPC